MAASSSGWPIHQLWPPPEVYWKTELDVVLFHGLQSTANDTSDAWSSTWTQRGHDDVCWPQKWLPIDLGEPLRIFSVSYNAHVVTSPHGHVSEIADNLFQTLFNPRYKWHDPIVLIGHSFGGLVLKSILVKLKSKQYCTDDWSKATYQCAKQFLSNVRGVVFYAVPHAGSSNISDYINKLLRCNDNRHHPGIIHNVEPWQRDMEQLTVDFEDIVKRNNINIYAFCEGRPIEHVGILVDFSSAQRSAGKNCYKVEDANHMEVCKPPSKEHPSYGLLLQFIITCIQVRRECAEPLQGNHDLPPMFGLDNYVERVEILLTSEGKNAAPQYVGVWGMGGVGKTLLLKNLYGSSKIHGHFKGAKFIWCTVGQTPDIMALFRALSEQLGHKPLKNLNIEDYKRKLYSQFGQKRVFLVLDDVWNNKTLNSLDLANGRGSVTLLTTRDKSLLERASPHISEVYMTPLSKDDSWSLFCVHAFRPPSNVPYELEALARCMAEQCQGLPLALKVIGEAMFGETIPEQWKLLLKRLKESRMQETTVEDELYERLKLGYDLLSERLKECFLYFAAFPEDSSISFNDILWYWIGEGLVPGNGGDDPRADAFSLLKKLWRRSFIESEVNSEEEDSLSFNSLNFKVHDVMRDLAFYILENDGGTPPAKHLYLYRPGENLEKFPREWEAISTARRVSLQCNKLKHLPGRFCAPDLLTLLLRANSCENSMISIPASFLSNFPKLKVLDLTCGQFDTLPEELADLKNLVYLNLSNCKNLKILPAAVTHLHMLQNLDLSFCRNLEYLPSGLPNLTSLQVLNTDWCLWLRWGEPTPSRMARAEELGQIYPTITTALEDICKLFTLTHLTIAGNISPMVKFPHNICALTQLRVLEFNFDLIEILPADMAYHFIHLQKLVIDSEQLEYLPRSFTCCDAFPALIVLQILCPLEEFPEVDEGALPQLRILCIWCPSLKMLPLSLEVLSNLRKLKLIDCEEKLKNCCRKNSKKSAVWREYFKIDFIDSEY